MLKSEHPRDFVRFGDFGLDPATGELSRGGTTIRLQPQPLKVLLALLRQPGELVTREELKQEVTPDTTFGDADHALNIAVAKLRSVLQDSPCNPRFIETLSRRGYRFVAPIEAKPPTNDPTGIPSGIPRRRKPRWIVAVLLVGLGALVVFALLKRSGALHNRRTVVVAAFKNNTGDPAFNNALRTGLSTELQHSSSLKLLSDERIAEARSLMMQPGNDPLTSQLALQVCQRTASAAAIHGSISMLGTQYVLELSAVSCRTGESLAYEQASTDNKDRVLSSLRSSATKLRKTLEKSLPSFSQGGAIEYVTTPSSEALYAYSLGCRAMFEGPNDYVAIALFERAISLDPEFAMAYAQLGTLYKNIGQSTRAAEKVSVAYGLRQHVSAHERLAIEAHYERAVTGNLEAARKNYELWAQLYPYDTAPLENLAVIQWAQGDCDDAVAVLRKALKISPEDGSIYADMMDAERCLGKLDAAKSVAEEASRHNADAPRLHLSLYLIGFVQHDGDRMRQETAYLSVLPEWQAIILCSEASTAAFSGQFRKARSLVRQSVVVALFVDQPETAADCYADASVWEALAGNTKDAVQQAKSALLLAQNSNVQAKSALSLGLSGDSRAAEQLANELTRRFPNDSEVRRSFLPSIRGVVGLRSGQVAEAVEMLTPAATFTGSTIVPGYLRGEALFASGQDSSAQREFQDIVDRPGVFANNIVAAVAQLELARILSRHGDNKKAASAYADLLDLWKDADPDIPVIQDARAEYQRIPLHKDTMK